jgi:enoyl-CoA hydratase/carnithine racemase
VEVRVPSSIRVAHNGPIATLSLSRPEARNALSLDVIDALIAALTDIAANEPVRVVLVEAEPPVFCAGHDLKEMTAHRADEDSGRAHFEAVFSRCSELMKRIVEAPQPVIAAVEGAATAAGCQLVAACDLAIAGASARFATPGVDIGLFCTTPAVALSRVAAPKHALEMLLTGDWIDAETAARIGLVNRVVPAGEAARAARELAEKIAGKSPQALRIGKRAFYAQRLLALEEAYALASKVMVENMLVADAIEGIGAVLAKRAPTWGE